MRSSAGRSSRQSRSAAGRAACCRRSAAPPRARSGAPSRSRPSNSAQPYGVNSGESGRIASSLNPRRSDGSALRNAQKSGALLRIACPTAVENVHPGRTYCWRDAGRATGVHRERDPGAGAIRPARRLDARARRHARLGRARLGRRGPRDPRLRRRHRLPEPRSRPGRVVRAIHEQVDRYLHQCFMVGIYEPYIELCRRLDELWPGLGATPTATKTLLSTPAPRRSRTPSRSHAPPPAGRASSCSTARSTGAPT